MPKYSVRLVGANAGARIEGSLLRDLLDVLVEGARRAVRLRVDGRSSAPGSLPSWLDRATSLRVPQGPRSGVSAIMGQWSGEETDEEISAFLRDLS